MRTNASYFWLIPIFAFAGLWVGRKNKDVVFFGVMALIGILLSKQVDDPFPGLYPWLFKNVPGPSSRPARRDTTG